MMKGISRCATFPWLWVLLVLLIGIESVPRRLAPAAGGPRMTDACQRPVVLPQHIRSVGLLTPTLAEYLFVTRAPDPIADGFGAHQIAVGDSLLRRVYPQLVVGRSVLLATSVWNTEALIGKRLDAVLDWSFRAPSLAAIGLPAVCLSTRRYEQAGLFENARIYANVLIQPGRAEDLSRRYDADLAQLAAQVQPFRKTGSSRALFLSINDAGRINAVRSPLRSRILQAFGDADARDELPAAFSIINAETVLTVDPDVIVLEPNPFAYAGPSPLDFMHNPVWMPLKAVRDRRVYNRPLGASGAFLGIVETPLFAQWAAELLHPQLPAGLRASMRRAYLRELHYEVSDAELDEMLAVERNRGSAGYQRFATPSSSPAPRDKR